MASYLIGDVQGCDAALQRLLAQIDFSPSRDTLYLLGDLINRGPDSLAVLRRLQALGASAQPLLGNHDLHGLALAHGVRAAHPSDTLQALCQAPDAPALWDWLAHQPLAVHAHGVLMVHAGVLPSWGVADTLALAQECQAQLRGPDRPAFLQQMYGNEPRAWAPGLQGPERWRVIVNALTRLRFCTADGHMEFATKEGQEAAPAGHMPWFDVPGRRTAGTLVAFGHWSTLGRLQRPDLLSLDTGCVWGGCLSAVRLGAEGPHEWFQVPCPRSAQPQPAVKGGAL